MHKKILIIALLLAPTSAFADAVTTLPPAGLLPSSPFYFLDSWSEGIQKLFAFSPDAKAKLDAKFAAERVAEIKAEIGKDGPKAKGLEVARTRMQENIAEATKIVDDQKAKGKDVSALAKEVDDLFILPRDELKGFLNDQEKDFNVKADEIRKRLIEARKTNNATLSSELEKQAVDIKSMTDSLRSDLRDDSQIFNQGKEQLKVSMNIKDKISQDIDDAVSEKSDVIQGYADRGRVPPANKVTDFDDFIFKAKDASEKNDFDGAAAALGQAKEILLEGWNQIDIYDRSVSNANAEVSAVVNRAQEKINNAVVNVKNAGIDTDDDDLNANIEYSKNRIRDSFKNVPEGQDIPNVSDVSSVEY